MYAGEHVSIPTGPPIMLDMPAKSDLAGSLPKALPTIESCMFVRNEWADIDVDVLPKSRPIIEPTVPKSLPIIEPRPIDDCDPMLELVGYSVSDLPASMKLGNIISF
jgi:hypothetical protein